MYGIPVLLRPKKKANHVSSSYRPRIDELEERCCPDGSHVTLNSLVLPGHLVQLSGTVTGGQVAGLQLQFTGAVSGVTTTDTNGDFSYTVTNLQYLGSQLTASGSIVVAFHLTFSDGTSSSPSFTVVSETGPKICTIGQS